MMTVRHEIPEGRAGEVGRHLLLGLALLVALAFLLSPGHAFAQEAKASMAELLKFEDEYFYKELRKLFGMDGENVAISRMVSYVNSLLIGIAGLLVSYYIAAGVAQTAHHGQVLGKNWSSLWGPVRLPLGMSLMVPALSGYCLAQIAVIKIAGMGMALATMVWTVGFNAVVKDGASILPPYVPMDTVRDHVSSMSENMTCLYVLNRQYALSKSWGGGNTGPAVEVVQSGVGFSFDGRVPRFNKQVCGGIFFSQVNAGPMIFNAFQGAMGAANLSGIISQAVDLGLGTAPMDPATETQIKGAFKVAMSGYRAAMIEAASAYSAQTLEAYNTKRLSTTGDRVPWVSAPVLYNDLIEANRNAMQAVTEAPQFMQVQMSRMPYDYRQDFTKVNTIVQGLIGDAATEMSREESLRMPDKPEVPADEGLVQWVAKAAMGWSERALQMPAEWLRHDPLNALVWLGNAVVTGMTGTMTTIIAGVIGLKALTGSAAGLLSWIPGLGSAAAGAEKGMTEGIQMALQLFGPMFTAFLLPTFLAGVTLAYVLPMLPTIYWLLAVCAYVILVAEAVIAAPLWMLSHLKMDGDDMVPRSAGMGYSVMANLMLRPSLMILGLGLGLGIYSIMGGLLAEMYVRSLSSALGTGLAGITGPIAGLIMLVLLAVALAKQCFGMISGLPDAVLRWIGAQGANPSQEGDRMYAAVAGSMKTGQMDHSTKAQIRQQNEQNKLAKLAAKKAAADSLNVGGSGVGGPNGGAGGSGGGGSPPAPQITPPRRT